MPVALRRSTVPIVAESKARRAADRHLKIAALAVAVAIGTMFATFESLRRTRAGAPTDVADGARASPAGSCVAEAAVPVERWVGRPPGVLLPANKIVAEADLSGVISPITFCGEDRVTERRAMVRTVERGGAIVSLNWVLTAPDGATKCYTASNRYLVLRDPFGEVTAYQLTATWIHGVIARSAAAEVTTTGEVSRWCQMNVGPAYRSRAKD